MREDLGIVPNFSKAIRISSASMLIPILLVLVLGGMLVVCIPPDNEGECTTPPVGVGCMLSIG